MAEPPRVSVKRDRPDFAPGFDDGDDEDGVEEEYVPIEEDEDEEEVDDAFCLDEGDDECGMEEEEKGDENK